MLTTFIEDPDYELFCRQRLQNPYPLFARLREQDPVHWCEPMKMWLVTRYDDVLDGIKNTSRLSSSRQGMYTDPLRSENREAARPMIEHLNRWLLNIDPPDHTRMRRLVNLAFTPRFLQRLVPRIEQIVEQLITETRMHDQIDFIESFCLPLPTIVICDMLGIPQQSRDQYRRDVDGLLYFSSAGGPGLNDTIDHARTCLDDLITIFDELISLRRDKPTDDLLSAMVRVEAEGDRLSRDELFALCVFLFLAGHETTMGMLASGTLALLQNPDQFELLKEDLDGRVTSAVEEFVRYEPSVTRGVRQVNQDFEWRGKQIRHGQTVTMLIGAANRDPGQFPNPDRLDITRHPNKHLGFGHGIHFCLGAPLARLESQIAFRSIARHLPNMRLATDHVEYKPAMGIRSLISLPIETS